MLLFLLTPLREGRPAIVKVEKAMISIFLLTPLREGRLVASVCPSRMRDNFYSRPCGRGDHQARRLRPLGHISTHAPAGGATGRSPVGAGSGNISTHAPAGGATSRPHP